MKKLAFLACATLLTSAVVFTGCKNDKNDPAKVPTVTTDIAISLPAQLGDNGAVRHMPGTTVQTGTTSGGVYGDFTANNGMKNIYLIPFAKREPVSTASERLGADINLGTTTIGTSDTHSNQDSKGRTKLFANAQVPNGTSAFLFYGESGNSNANNFVKGVLNHTIANEPASYKFTLQPIVTNIDDATVDDPDDAYDKLIAYLNLVANAENKESGAADYASMKKWYEYTTALNEGYTELFDSYKSLNVLSSFGIQRMMTDLYKTLMLNAATDTLANNIKEAIANSTYASVDGSGNVTLVSTLQNYPQKHGLPVGAVAVAWDNTNHAFVGNNAASSYGQTNVLAPNQLDRYVYPASLWYFANSTIKTSTTKQAEHYTDGASWADILAQYDNKYSVNSTTRSIALVDTIQYAVARFDVSVMIGGTDNALVDNDPVATANKVANPAGGYTMKAVLVGGQRNVGFDFTPATYPLTPVNDYVIYDSLMTTDINATTTGYSAANSTLVLETAANQDIVIAVEFVNTSDKDFYGKDGIVPVGGRFYLVGKLPAASATRTENKVFKQDYTTIANITIPSLQNAYNVIPDLRAPQLEIGMLVDLYWKSGTTYTINFD